MQQQFSVLCFAVAIMLAITILLSSSSSTTCSAFRPPPAIITTRRNLSATTATAKTSLFLSSSSPKVIMPYGDDQMPFYAMGVNLALQVGGGEKLLNSDTNELDIMLKGFADTLKGTLDGDVDARTILSTYGPALNEILQQRSQELLDSVKQDGAYFVQEFLKSNNEAKQTESGLVYLEKTKGTGVTPTLDSTVEVHYHGTLSDGTVFDSSIDRGETISFPLQGVIKGWQEGLQLMKEGGKAVLLCPPDISYGDQGSGGVIPPGATLRFDVELIKVSEPPKPIKGEGEEPETVRINIDDILAAKQKQEENRGDSS